MVLTPAAWLPGTTACVLSCTGKGCHGAAVNAQHKHAWNQVCRPDAPAQVLDANKSAPEQLASLYKQFLPLLGNSAEATVQNFTEQAQAVSLSEVRDQLERCRAAADSIK